MVNGLRRIPRTVWLFLGVMALILVPFCLFEEGINATFEALTSSSQTFLLVATILFLALALDIFLPVPSSLASTMCGMTLGLGWGFLLSFMAMNVSCLLGYLLGKVCSARAQRMIGEHETQLLRGFFQRYDVAVLVALRAVPVFAEASILFAGITRTPPLKTTLLLLLANAAVSLPYAYVGHLGKTTHAMLPAFLTSLAISGCILLGAFLHHRLYRSTRHI